MKRVMIVLALIMSVVCANAQVLSGVWGVPFGVSVEESKRIVAEKHGVRPTSVEKDMVEYGPCVFGDFEAVGVRLRYENDKLYMAEVYMAGADIMQMFDRYMAVTGELEKKYGKSDWSIALFKGDKKEKASNHKVVAKYKDATRANLWWFPKGSKSAKAKGAILCSVEDENNFKLLYVENETYNKVAARNQAKALTDY